MAPVTERTNRNHCDGLVVDADRCDLMGASGLVWGGPPRRATTERGRRRPSRRVASPPKPTALLPSSPPSLPAHHVERLVESREKESVNGGGEGEEAGRLDEERAGHRGGGWLDGGRVRERTAVNALLGAIDRRTPWDGPRTRAPPHAPCNSRVFPFHPIVGYRTAS